MNFSKLGKAFSISMLLASMALFAQSPAPSAGAQQQPPRRPAAAPQGRAAAPAVATAPLPAGQAGVHGQVFDQTGAVIPAATVAIMNLQAQKDMPASEFGQYSFRPLPPGKYTVQVSANGFTTYENAEVTLTADQDKQLDITLTVASEKQEVKVEETNLAQLSVDAASNVGAIVMKGQDLEALPDDPDDLQADLQALAGPTAGPNGGQIYVDGFTGGRLPPKESIREIRINSNPFSAEYDRLGFGRIEILTKPGFDKLRGSVSFTFGDNALNARNPFSTVKPDADHKQYGATLGGALGKHASFFLDFERRDTSEGTLVNGLQLDSGFNIVPLNIAFPTPSHRTTIGPRFDYQLGKNNTLTFRYSFTNNAQDSLGVGGFTTPSQAYDQRSKEQVANIVETSILSPKVVNETRVQLDVSRTGSVGGTGLPTIAVAQAFQAGGAGYGYNYSDTIRNEFSNFTSFTSGKHFLKAGVRIRTANEASYTQQNYNGQYDFASINTYQVTVAGFALGLPLSTISIPCANYGAAGGNAKTAPVYSGPGFQGTLNVCGGGLQSYVQYAGQGGAKFSSAGVSQFDVGAFVQDDWRLRQNFSVNLGFRYEGQNNISNKADFAPRVAFAWGIGPGGKSRTPKTVIRGGFGMFYDRFSESYTLTQLRQNGVNQLVYQLNQSSQPNQASVNTTLPFANYTSLSALSTNPPLSVLGTQAPTIREVQNGLHAPYIMQSVLTMERQLPKNTTLSLQYMSSRGVHELRSRNINAPLPGTYGVTGVNPVYPLFSQNGTGQIDLYESSGLFRQNQIVASVNTRFSTKISMFGYYAYGVAYSNTDNANSYPANQYDESTEWSRAAFNVRNRGLVSGTINAKWGVRFSPFITMASGTPFNITDGAAVGGDGLFNARPALASSASLPGNLRVTPYGSFDLVPQPGETIITRNYGIGPGNFSVNLRVSKTWGFGEKAATPAQNQDPGAQQRRMAGMGGPGGPGGGAPGGGGPRGGGGGGPRGGGAGGFGGGDSAAGRYNLTLSANARNLFNHTNPGQPVGNLLSPTFGESTALGGGGFGGGQTANRRIDISLRFSF